MTALLSSTALSGCVPYYYTAKPGVSGKVLDGRTGHSIAGARIILAAQGISGSAVSATDGSFLVPGKQQWGTYMPPMDPADWQIHVTIQAKGYVPVSRDFGTSSMSPPVKSLGDISLRRGER